MTRNKANRLTGILILSLVTATALFSQVQDTLLVAGDPMKGARFGHSVAVDGDTLIVGAPLSEEKLETLRKLYEAGAISRIEEGSAYIFHFGSDSWNEEKPKLTATQDPAAKAGDQFGFSVGIRSNRALIGAWQNSTGGDVSGAAYIFSGNGGWHFGQKLPDSSDQAFLSPGDNFGNAVAVKGDYAAVGVPKDDSVAVNAGLVYIYDLDPPGQATLLLPWIPMAEQRFGTSISLSDSGYLAVGAPSASTNAQAGLVYIFERSDSTWAEMQMIPSEQSQSRPGDLFGQSVAISGDGQFLVAGAPSPGGAGSAYVYRRDTSSWKLDAKLLIPSGASPMDDSFGWSVAISDTAGYAIVGSPTKNDSGAAYQFRRRGDKWSLGKRLSSSFSKMNENINLGWSVDISGDGTFAVAGAPGDNNTNGTAFVFDLKNKPPQVLKEIPDILLTVDGPNYVVEDLDPFFEDPDPFTFKDSQDTLRFSVLSSDSTVATARVIGESLTVSLAAANHLHLGDTAIISVSAIDAEGDSIQTNFNVFVNFPPYVKNPNPLADTTMILGCDASFSRSLTEVFGDSDNVDINFAISSNLNGEVAKAVIMRDLLSVSAKETGNTTIEIMADDGRGGRETTCFTVTVAANQPSFKISPDAEAVEEGNSLDVRVTIDPDSAATRVVLHYRKGSSDQRMTTEMDSIGAGQYKATIPDSFVTDEGVDYYITATDIKGNCARVPSDSTGWLSVPVKIKGRTHPLTITGSENTAYTLISVPFSLKDSAVVTVLRDLEEPNRKKWRLFKLQDTHLDNDSPDYDEYPEEFSSFEKGQAYWLIVKDNKDNRKSIRTGPGTTVPTSKAFRINLNTGWNFISNPFNFPISTANMSLMIDTTLNVQANLRTFGGSWNMPMNNKIEEIKPFIGYALRVFSADVLQITPNQQRESGNISNTQEDRKLWAIRILAQRSNAIDVDNVAMALSNASLEWDTYDLPEPPVIGEFVSVYFPHMEWGDYRGRYCIDARPDPTNGEIWDFEIQTSTPDKVDLTFEGIGEVPLEFGVWLVDEMLGISQNLRQNNRFSVAANTGSPARKLKLVVGKKAFIGQEVPDEQTIPTEFKLSQNFPNPFNPATTIRYSLPKAQKVTLKVYNLLGEEVVTLVQDEEKTAGHHFTIWDGRNQSGQPVSSGLYLYHLHAGKITKIKKMALVK